MATDYTDRLRALPLFAALSEANLQEVNQIVRLSRRSAGEVIFREGDDSQQLYIIESGQVSVFRRDPAGVEVIVRLLGPGRFFGETGLLYNEHRNATVQTNSDTTFFVVESRGFETLLHMPSVRKQLEAAAQRRASPLPRFEWQLPDEAAVAVSNRSLIPLILESTLRLTVWIGLSVLLFVMSFIPLPGLAPAAVPWLLRSASLVLFILTLMYNIFDWTNDVLVVTNQRVILLERFGWIRETRQELPIAAIQGVTLAHSGILQTLLQVTNISVATIGSKIVFTHIRNGPFMQERILDQRTLAQQGEQRQEMETIRSELLRVLRPALPPDTAEPKNAPAATAAPAQAPAVA
jgi:CRP-like cAMP-binding protein